MAQTRPTTNGDLTHATASSTALHPDIDWKLIERVIDAVPEGVVGIGALDVAWGEVTSEVTLDQSLESAHYRLLLKIHEQRGSTLRARLDKYLDGIRDVRDSISGETQGALGESGYGWDGQAEGEVGSQGMGWETTGTEGRGGDQRVDVRTMGSSQIDRGRNHHQLTTQHHENNENNDDQRPTIRRPTQSQSQSQSQSGDEFRHRPKSQSQPGYDIPSTPNDIKRRVPFLADVPSDAETIEDSPAKHSSSAFTYPNDQTTFSPVAPKVHELGDRQIVAQDDEQYMDERWRGLDSFDQGRDAAGETTVDYNSEQYGGRSVGSEGSRGSPRIGMGMMKGHGGAKFNPQGSQAGGSNGYGKVPVTYGGLAYPSSTPSSTPAAAPIRARRRSSLSSISSQYRSNPRPHASQLPPQNMLQQSASTIPNLSPPAMPLPTPPPRILQAVHRSENVRALDREARKIEEAFQGDLRGMEELADRFWKEGWMMRGFGRWLRMSDEVQDKIQVLQAKIPTHDHLRLSLLFPRWCRAHSRHLSDRGKAEIHHSLTLQAKSFDEWRIAARHRQNERLGDEFLDRKEEELKRELFGRWWGVVQKRHVERWKEELKGKEAEWMDMRERNLVTDTFKHWKLHTKATRLLRDQDSGLLAQSFDIWLDSTRANHILRDREQDWKHRTEAVIEVKSWNLWRKVKRLRDAEREVVWMVDEGVAARVLEGMVVKFRLVQKAKSMQQQNLLKHALASWIAKRQAIKEMHRQAHKRIVDNEASLVTLAFGRWHLRHRGLQVKQQGTKAMLGLAFSVWREKARVVQRNQDLASDISARRDLGRFRNAFDHWKSLAAKIKADEAKADERLVLVTHHKALERWKTRMEQIKHKEKQALNCRAFHLQRRYFKAWRGSQLVSVQRRYVAEREMGLCKVYFRFWLDEIRTRRQHEKSVEQFQRKHAEALKRIAFTGWWQSLLTHRLREEGVIATDDKKLLQFGMAAWMNATKAKGDLISLAISFRDIKQKESLQALLQYWKAVAQQSKDRREQMVAVEEDYNERLMSLALRTWSIKLKMRKLVPIADRMLMTSADALLFLAFDKWKSRSQRLPAIAFDRLNTKNRYWTIWREAFPKAQRLREARQVEEKKLLSDVLQLWKEAYRKKVARRAAARIRGSAGLFSLKPASPPAAISTFDQAQQEATKPVVERRPRTSLLSFGR